MVLFAIIIVFFGFAVWPTSSATDWAVVRLDPFGRPQHCWELRRTTIHEDTVNKEIYWQSSSGNRVYLASPYLRVLVQSNQWDLAFREIGVSREECKQALKRIEE